MKNFLAVFCTVLLLAGCTTMGTSDGDSTKDWIKIDSSKQDLDGKIMDICYRLDIRFNPPDAIYDINPDMACITKCCWYGERNKVEINMNDNFARNLAIHGRAVKYTPEKLTFHLSYSSFLNTIHGRVEPRGVLKSGGLIMLKTEEFTTQSSRLPVSNEPVSAKIYGEDSAVVGTYLFKSTPAATGEVAKAEAEAVKAMAAEQPLPPPPPPAPEPEPQFIEAQSVLAAAAQKPEPAPAPQIVAAKIAPVVVVPKPLPAPVPPPSPVQQSAAAKNIPPLASGQPIPPSPGRPLYEETKEPPQMPASGNLRAREEYYQKQLAYEREQAVLLLKRFYNTDIDAYIMSLDKNYKEKGQILLANDRSWATTKVGSPIFRVTCKVNGQLGKTQKTMKPHPIACGVFQVDLDDQTVIPIDVLARSIVSGEYKD